VSDLPGAFALILSALTTLPIWQALGLAVACWVVLFAPSIGGVDIDAFRRSGGRSHSFLGLVHREGDVRADLSHTAAPSSDGQGRYRERSIVQAPSPAFQADPDPLAIASSAVTASAGSSRLAAAKFSRRWASDEVPGMSRILGER